MTVEPQGGCLEARSLESLAIGWKNESLESLAIGCGGTALLSGCLEVSNRLLMLCAWCDVRMRLTIHALCVSKLRSSKTDDLDRS